MIPTALLRVTSRGGALHPRYLDPSDPERLDQAERVGAVVAAAVARSARWGELADELEEVAVTEDDPVLWRGLAHVALARTEAGNDPPLDPGPLREALFRAAAAAGVGRPDGPRAQDFVATWAAAQGHRPDDVWASLYGDLPAESTLTDHAVPPPEALLHRYNLGLVQGVLRSAIALRLVLTRPTPGRMRQLLRWLRFHQLLHRAERRGDDLELHIDGPVSLFSASTRYGRALASFLPAVLLHEEPWALEARVEWTRRRVHRTLRVSRDDGLRSPLPDTGAWRSKAMDQLSRRLAEEPGPFRYADGERPLPVGRGEVLFPEFVARDGDRVAHLAAIGAWRPERLEAILRTLDAEGPANLVLLASRKAGLGKGASPPEHPRVVWYADVVPVAAVRAAVERCAGPDAPSGPDAQAEPPS